jgi:predicted O-methyltransferase YrrM
VFYGLCQLAKEDATIISIDLPGGPFGGGYTAEEERRFQAFGRNGQTLYFVKADSHAESTLKNLKDILKKRPIDLLLIDGDHTYDGVKKDWEMYSPLVKKGGVVAFHDICHHPTVPECQVEKFWKEVKHGKKTLEFIDKEDQSWGGIGVVLT